MCVYEYVLVTLPLTLYCPEMKHNTQFAMWLVKNICFRLQYNDYQCKCLSPLFAYFSQANVFDTAGGERFRTLTSNYFLNSDAAILMYSIEDQYSFERLEDEAENAMQFVDAEEFVWALIGNKADLPLEIEESNIKAKGKELRTPLLFYTSAKSGINVKESLEAVIKHVHRKRAGQPKKELFIKGSDPIVVNRVGNKANGKMNGGCC